MLPELTTARLHLSELRPADAPDLGALQNTPAHWRLQAVEPAEFTDPAFRMRMYLKHRGRHDARRLLVFAARHKDTGDLVGQVSLQRSAPRVASLGLGVGDAHWGAGYGTELAARLIDFGFGFAGLHRIEADVSLDNLACIRVLEKTGMRREGVARECIFAQGKWWTEAKYGLLASDARLHQPARAETAAANDAPPLISCPSYRPAPDPP